MQQKGSHAALSCKVPQELSMWRFTLRRASWLIRQQRGASSSASLDVELKPDEVVAALDKHIVGQPEAKVATAIALRDQWRRKQLDPELQREILPNNILMVGPTGVGKTEVARRLAMLARAPFVKCEATKFTEVGIYGTDTESMVVDLVEAAARQAEQRAKEAERPKARERAIERVIAAIGWKGASEREAIRAMLRDGKMNEEVVEVETAPRHGGGGKMMGNIFGGMPVGGSIAIGMPREMAKAAGGPGGMPLNKVFEALERGGGGGGGVGEEASKARLKVGEALPRLEEEELEKQLSGLDLDAIAVEQAQERGIVFVDEIDKLVRRGEGGMGGAFSKGEGVQKELLALLEGTTVRTPRGPVSTAHILFVCAGAFHQAKPSDLLPELQGRLPVRVELKALTEVQQSKLMETEGVELTFTEDAVAEIARLAARVNSTVENIGARRLRTVVSKMMEEVSFNAHRLKGTKVEVDAEYVRAHTGDMASKVDIAKYIL